MAECSDGKLVLLVRHASRAIRWDLRDKYHAIKYWSESAFQSLQEFEAPRVEGNCGSLDVGSSFIAISDYETPGFNRTVAIAGHLAERLQLQEDVRELAIYHGCHLVAEQTAKIYQQVLAKHGLLVVFSSEIWLNPEATDYSKIDGCIGDAEAECVMFVGHQPALTNIARHLLQPNKLPADTLPLGGSEVACIKMGEDRRLRWMLTEKSAEQLDELKEKIQSKYDVAKFILGAFVVNTGLILSADLWSKPVWPNRIMAYLAVLFAGASLIFTAATLFSYDELLMPSAFWGSGTISGNGCRAKLSRWLRGAGHPEWNVERPPCQEHVVIFYEMVHIWEYFFKRAIFTAFASVAFSVVAAAYSAPIVLPNRWIVPDWIALEGIILVLLAGAVLVYSIFTYQRNRPKLDISD